MKKFMIALAAVAMAACSQAAAIKWQVTAIGYNGWNVYVYNGQSADIGTVLSTVLPAAEAPAGWTSKLTTITTGSSPISSRGTLTNQSLGDVDLSATWTAVLFDGEIAAGSKFAVMESYLASDYAYSGPDTPTTMRFASIKTTGTLTTSGGPTPGPIPEPTSGLLLLLGVAGMALRRKQK